jgi:hypothetical protein
VWGFPFPFQSLLVHRQPHHPPLVCACAMSSSAGLRGCNLNLLQGSSRMEPNSEDVMCRRKVYFLAQNDCNFH